MSLQLFEASGSPNPELSGLPTLQKSQGLSFQTLRLLSLQILNSRDFQLFKNLEEEVKKAAFRSFCTTSRAVRDFWFFKNLEEEVQKLASNFSGMLTSESVQKRDPRMLLLFYSKVHIFGLQILEISEIRSSKKSSEGVAKSCRKQLSAAFPQTHRTFWTSKKS